MDRLNVNKKIKTEDNEFLPVPALRNKIKQNKWHDIRLFSEWTRGQKLRIFF